MDWIKTGWGPELSQDFDPKAVFTLDCRSAKHTGKQPIKAAVRAIKKIAKN